jgi:lipid-binding SYLF domain-containing protein
MSRLFPAALAVMGIACISLGFATVARADDAAERAEIEKDVDQALAELYKSVPGSADVAKEAKGILVFPAIYKAGFIIGGHHGNGALRVEGKSVAYYSTTGASFGLQAGAERRSMAVMFMTQDALTHFENSSGWDLGADADVAVVQIGANGAVDMARLGKPVEAFVFGNSGLMANLSLEGTKVSRSDLEPAAASGSSMPK